MTKDVNLDQLQKDAVEIFNQGFACSESIIYAIKKNFELEMSDDAIAMSSGFPWGLGGGGCICGALAGGTMCIGYFFGRKTPGDPKINKCFELTKELHDFFRETCGGTCCRILNKKEKKRILLEKKRAVYEICCRYREENSRNYLERIVKLKGRS